MRLPVKSFAANSSISTGLNGFINAFINFFFSTNMAKLYVQSTSSKGDGANCMSLKKFQQFDCHKESSLYDDLLRCKMTI